LTALVAFAAALAGGGTPALGKRAAVSKSDQSPAMSAGVERLIADLRERESGLERKERELAERERSIGELEDQIEERVSELEAMREALEKRIKAWNAKGGDRVARLAKVYSEMPPAKVAPLLQGLDDDLATSILAKMKQKKSAAILAQLPRANALRLSRRLARPLAADFGGR
jgi:flagellar motility protein MotE (MotC chaperone)